MHELDWIVGEVLKSLETNGLTEKTLVIFTSDNGGMLNNTAQKAWKAGHRQNGKLLGHKFGAWEGGHRVPMVVKWPGRVPAGSTSNALIGQVDLVPTFAAIAGAKIDKDALIDGVDQSAELKGVATKPARETLVISPNSPKHLTIRKGKWVYIPARDEGGFQGKKIGDHLLSGAASQKLTKLVNNDVVDGKIRPGAPIAQLYDLQDDPYQSKNVHDDHPDVVAVLAAELKNWRSEIPNSPPLGWINLKQVGARKASVNPNQNAAPRIAAGKSKRSAAFDFESGKLAPWKVVEGRFGNLIGSRPKFFHSDQEYNKQGKYYMTTLEPSKDAAKGKDAQTGVVVSPLFVPKPGKMTFRVGGGKGNLTYVALCSDEGKELHLARGANNQLMQKAEWNLTPYVGKKVFIKVVDQSTTGWGHITVDNFEFDGKILNEYPKLDKR